jgi:hypothetical protein
MLILIGWMRRPTLLGAKFDECSACGVPGPHLVLRTTYWFTFFRIPVLLLWMKHGLLCPECGAIEPLGFLQVRRAFQAGRLPLSRPRRGFHAALLEQHRGPDARDLSSFGLAEGASQAEIKERWRELAKTAHPDNGGSTSAFVDLQAAYRRLTSADLTREKQPSEAEVFDPVVQNPRRGFFDGYLKFWAVAAAAVLVLGMVGPHSTPTPSYSSPYSAPIIPANVSGTAHACWYSGTTLNGCEDDTSGAMLFGTQSGLMTTCYFVEPLLEGQLAQCRY